MHGSVRSIIIIVFVPISLALADSLIVVFPRLDPCAPLAAYDTVRIKLAKNEQKTLTS